MFTKLKDFFNFNATERNGILVLILLIAIVAFIPGLYRYYSKPEEVDFTEFQEEIEAFEKNREADSVPGFRQSDMDDNKAIQFPEKEKVTPFPFDPNNLPAQKWKQLGLKEWQIRIIQKYESKGGKFHKKEDLKKIYGITQDQFETLEPFIVMPEEKSITGTAKTITYPNARKPIIVDINSADTTTLQELRGIGPSFARRIVKYRDILGGYYKLEQLLEVYGFDQQRYDQVAAYCLLGDGPFRKLHLNTATTAELKKHPYLDYYIAKAIVDRRVAKGNFTSVSQLKEISIISPELFEKISHYLTVE